MSADTRQDSAKQFTKKDLPDAEVELAGDIPIAELEPYKKAALEHIAEHLELPGFRPGKVPADMALKKVGEVALLEEAVELFVKDFYPELITAHKLDAVGRPNIHITKLAPGNPVGLVVRSTVYPQVRLVEDWKNIGDDIAAETPLPATEEEVTQTLEQLRQSRKQGEVVPELNDEFAKSVGAFENLVALKEQITKGITEEKARAAKDKRRGKVIEALLQKTVLPVPKIFVESELEKILAQMREDIGRMGLQFDDYLKKLNKTEEEIRKEFREQATKRAKLQLVLNKIAEVEEVVADEEAVEQEIKHALEHFPQAKPDLVRVHVETVMRNEKVLKMLEGDK